MSLATGIDCQGLLDLLEGGGGGLSKVATVWPDSSCTVSIQGIVPAPVSTGSLASLVSSTAPFIRSWCRGED